eukprot:COSAG05_NODE_1240_length_5422_cov_6.791283_3_plen_167_part_00
MLSEIYSKNLRRAKPILFDRWNASQNAIAARGHTRELSPQTERMIQTTRETYQMHGGKWTRTPAISLSWMPLVYVWGIQVGYVVPSEEVLPVLARMRVARCPQLPPKLHRLVVAPTPPSVSAGGATCRPSHEIYLHAMQCARGSSGSWNGGWFQFSIFHLDAPRIS